MCTHCGESMGEGYWNDGSSAAKLPRTLHGIDNIILLVSCVYTCDKHHKLVAHDEAILGLFPPEVTLPFLLLYRTGFSRNLVDMCISLCRRGINFYNMETIITERRWEMFVRQQNMLGKSCTTDDFLKSEISKSPSNDVLTKCFLSEFLQYEELYLNEMMCIPLGETISFDHTFKVAANIGYLREDGKWIPQYNGLFIVLNNEGKVVTWQLTNGTSFSQVKVLLENLVKRSGSQEINTIYIDDCCKLREKIKTVFGPTVSVKLDLFHAVQRITRTLSRKHALARQCIEELRLVFRSKGDSGKERLSQTPSVPIISENFDAFAAKWKNVADDGGVKLFSTDTTKAVQNLKRHVSAGCLSNIPKGGGTAKNERFHQHVHSFFQRSRIGILLAYALITMIMHAHNSSIKMKGKLIIRPIIASPLKGTNISNSPMGIMPKERLLQSNDIWEMDMSDRIMDTNLIISIYNRAQQKLHISRGLSKMKLKNMAEAVSSFDVLEVANLRRGEFVHAELQSILSTYGLTFSPVAKDGNCFFHAVSMNIMARIDKWSCHLHTLGISDFTSLTLSMKLRQAFVREVTGSNQHIYEEFIQQANFNFVIEANRFLQDGFFGSCIGDFMPMAMSTLLQASLVIFTTTQPMYVVPVDGSTPDGSIFLVYTLEGPGHYDAAITYSDTIGSKSAGSTSTLDQSHTQKCSCGVNKATPGSTSCSPNPLYSVRCKCYRNSKPCGIFCRSRAAVTLMVKNHKERRGSDDVLMSLKSKKFPQAKSLHWIGVSPCH